MNISLIKKLLFLLLITAILSSITLAEREDLSEYDQITLSLKLNNEILVQGEASYVTANLSWFPRQTYRQTAEINTYNGNLKDNSVDYKWNNPSSKIKLLLTANLDLTNDYKIISQEIPYPSNIPSEITPYLLPGEIIDTNKDIERLSLSLTANEDDYYSAVFRIADWVTTNINYDLNSVTSEATQKSSWVLDQKAGVCDELTSLFISLLRASGIPAKFVSGVAYTNLETLDAWGNHGWSEVYFPGIGWVPFDVTYGQYGYIDATHIKLKDSIDTKDHNLEYSMLSQNAQMTTTPLEHEVIIISKQKTKHSDYTVNLEIYDDEISSKSYNLLTAKIKSNLPYYTSTRFSLAQTQGLEILGSKDQNLLFKPREEKTIYFVLKQTEEVPEGYYVTYPLKFYAAREELGSTSFQAKKFGDYYEPSFFKEYIQNDNQELITPINCEEKKAYLGEELTITCGLESTKENAKICFEKKCFYDNPNKFVLTTKCEKTGINNKQLAVSATSLNAKGLVKYQCLDETKLSITNINATNPVSFEDKAVISFMLNRESESIPKNLIIKLIHDNFEQEWSLPELTERKGYELKYSGKMLDIKNNDFKIIVDYEDSLGQTYKEETTFNVELEGLTIQNKVMIYLYEAERYLRQLLGE